MNTSDPFIENCKRILKSKYPPLSDDPREVVRSFGKIDRIDFAEHLHTEFYGISIYERNGQCHLEPADVAALAGASERELWAAIFKTVCPHEHLPARS